MIERYVSNERIRYREALTDLLSSITKNKADNIVLEALDENAIDWDKLSFAGSLISIKTNPYQDHRSIGAKSMFSMNSKSPGSRMLTNNQILNKVKVNNSRYGRESRNNKPEFSFNNYVNTDGAKGSPDDIFQVKNKIKDYTTNYPHNTGQILSKSIKKP